MVTFDFNKTPITQIADAIIIDASNRGASDIHLDPRENGIMTRIRVDGDLVDYAYIPKMYERNLTTRIKLMSNMNITENRLPQDGAIKGKFGDKDLDMRVSCLPTNEGEKIVIRILDYSRSLSGLDKLGFNQENYQKLLRMIGNPNGIILITGATGSGKSTTVYSILQALNKEETNIITVEDPIEMNIEGMNQVQVNSEIGLDFAVVLRSILRQDPNVILIGEIRDSETAQIAVRASITGHLVLSTIHTNNSLSTIERLLDMNVERYLLSSALAGIISQRLAKMLCPKCRIKRKTTPYEKKVFHLAMNKDVDEIYDANHNGCDYCHKGYRGRIAIQEVLEITDHIKSTINSSNTNSDKLRELVYGSGNVITLLQDGLGKVLNGFTTFEEIYRIIEIDNDIEDSCFAEEKKEEEQKQKEKEQPAVTSIPTEKIKNEKETATIKTEQAATSIIGNKENLMKVTTPPIINNTPKQIVLEDKKIPTTPSVPIQQNSNLTELKKEQPTVPSIPSKKIKKEKETETPITKKVVQPNNLNTKDNSQRTQNMQTPNEGNTSIKKEIQKKILPITNTSNLVSTKKEETVNKHINTPQNSIQSPPKTSPTLPNLNLKTTPKPQIQTENKTVEKEIKVPLIPIIDEKQKMEVKTNNPKKENTPPPTSISPKSNIDKINNFFNNNLNTSQITINNKIPISSIPNNNSTTNITNKPNINNLIFPSNKKS